MIRKQFILLILIASFIPRTQANNTLTLGLKEAKAHALQFNKNIQNSSLAVKKSQEQIKATIAAGLPQVNASVDYNNAMGAEITFQPDGNMPASTIPINPTSTFQVQVSQIIFNANYIIGVQTAKLYSELSEKSQMKAEEEIINEVINTYQLILISDASLNILKSNIINLQQVYEKTKPMVEFGMLEKVELDQLAVQVNTLKSAVNSAERQLELTNNMLRLLLGVHIDTELILTDKLDDFLLFDPLAAIENGDFNLHNNIDYQLMLSQEQIKKKEIDQAKAGYLPSINGYYSYSNKLIKPNFDMTPNNMIGLQMNIPIFSGGERRSKVKQSQIEMDQFQNEKSLMQDQLLLQFNQQIFNLRNARENFENQSLNVEVSREVYKTYRQRFDQGMISSLELTTADNNYLKAESDYLQAAMELLQAQNELNKLTGQLRNNI